MTTNKQLAHAFSMARKYLWNGVGPKRKTNFVCYALDDAYTAGKIDATTAMEAQAIIHDRLGKALTLEGWWLYNHPSVYSRKRTPKQVQATRLAWLNSLITEFGGTP